MSTWTIGDWCTYLPIVLAAVLLALIQGVKDMEGSGAPAFLKKPILNYLPLLLLILGGAAFLARQFGPVARLLDNVPKIEAGSSSPAPTPPVQKTFPDDEKARLRPLVNQLIAIFDSDGFATWRPIEQLQTDIQNNFDDPRGWLLEPDALISRLTDVQAKVRALNDEIFKEFLPAHQSDKAELTPLVGDDAAIRSFTQATQGFLGSIRTVARLQEKSTDKALTLPDAMSLTVQNYRDFFGAVNGLKAWLDACEKRLKQKHDELL